MKDLKPLKPVVLFGGASAESAAFGVALRDGGVGVIQTTLVTSTYVDVSLSDMALPDASSESGVTHEGDGAFTVTNSGTYNYVWQMTAFHSGISGAVAVDFTYGIWNGSSFDEVTAADVSESLDIGNRTVSTNALYLQFAFNNISLTAGQRVGLMVERTGGVTQDLRIRNASVSIYKVA